MGYWGRVKNFELLHIDWIILRGLSFLFYKCGMCLASSSKDLKLSRALMLLCLVNVRAFSTMQSSVIVMKN